MTDNKRPPRRPAARAPTAPADRRPAASAPPSEARDDARIAKIMARAGLCSRRDAESWIAAGRVEVNGTVIDSPALNVGPGDRITIDGKPLPEREQTRLYMFHKPRGVVTTSRDPEGRETIFDVLPPDLPRVVTIGRLDINTEGLLLLTNDGGLARKLELPATGWARRYRVRANGEVTQPQLDELAKGMTVEGIDYAGIEARLDRVQGANVWLTMSLREGKNREIKRILEHLGLAVTRLIRLSFGPFQLGDLAAGAVEQVPIRVLRDQLGETLAREAGVDLEDRPEQRAARERSAPALTPRPVGPPQDQGRPKAGPRAHVSVLRSARDETTTEGRRRTERGATADRKGRAVAVERVSSTVKRETSDDSRNARRFTREAPGGGETPRSAPRRFAAERPSAAERPVAPERQRRAGPVAWRERSDGASYDAPRPEGRAPASRRPAEAPRPERADRPRPERGEQPRPERGEQPRPRRGEQPRSERGEQPRSRSLGDRPSRSRDERPEGRTGVAGRTDGARPVTGRASRAGRDERPGRNAGPAAPRERSAAPRERSAGPRERSAAPRTGAEGRVLGPFGDRRAGDKGERVRSRPERRPDGEAVPLRPADRPRHRAAARAHGIARRLRAARRQAQDAAAERRGRTARAAAQRRAARGQTGRLQAARRQTRRRRARARQPAGSGPARGKPAGSGPRSRPSGGRPRG